MRSPRLLLAVLATLVVVALVATGCTINIGTGGSAGGATGGSTTGTKQSTSATGPKVGDTVAAKWTDGNYWLATVEKVEPAGVTVKYTDDNTTNTVSVTEIRPIAVKSWSVGDKVLAVWSSGRFYPGTVEKAAGSTYTIKWDDGSTPSEVEATKIIAVP
jgi:hypothetical protein